MVDHLVGELVVGEDPALVVEEGLRKAARSGRFLVILMGGILLSLCSSSNLTSALTPQAMGPRAKISDFMLSAPVTVPYSEMVALGYSSMAEQSTPKVEQVRQVLMAEGVVSTLPQKPMEESEEQAM